jgi:hypothetical protein
MAKMTHQQYEDAKETLREISHILKTERLTAKERDELEIHAASLSGAIMSPWLPMSLSSTLLMLAIVLLGVEQVVVARNYEPLLLWLLLPFFSPRIVGEVVHLGGRVVGFIQWGRWS